MSGMQVNQVELTEEEMKKQIEINYGRSLKLNKGNYDQDAPMWHEKVTIDLNGETQEQVLEIESLEYEALKKRIDERANQEWAASKLTLSGLRVREKDGKKYPSVTSILNPEPYTGNPEYGTRGTEVHFLVDHFIDTEEWRQPSVPLQTLKYEDLKYKEFFEKFGSRIKPIKGDYKNLEVYHEKLMYSGEIDRLLSVDAKPSLTDYKTGGWSWEQLIAYWYGLPEPLKKKISQLAVFDLKLCELEILPIIDPKFQSGWWNFIYKRGVFKGRFGA